MTYTHPGYMSYRRRCIYAAASVHSGLIKIRFKPASYFIETPYKIRTNPAILNIAVNTRVYPSPDSRGHRVDLFNGVSLIPPSPPKEAVFHTIKRPAHH